jgi:hypothetical protein
MQDSGEMRREIADVHAVAMRAGRPAFCCLQSRHSKARLDEGGTWPARSAFLHFALQQISIDTLLTGNGIRAGLSVLVHLGM